MQARKLKELMNEIDYIYHFRDGKVCIGSYMCHDLITVNAKTLTVQYALDTFHEGRQALKNENLEFIWDKLHELIESGEIHDIINGRDIIDNPLPVFTVDKGKLVESVTDYYEYLNTDDNGVLMYDNTHFKTKEEAINYGLEEYKSEIKFFERKISEREKEIEEINERKTEAKSFIEQLKSL